MSSQLELYGVGACLAALPSLAMPDFAICRGGSGLPFDLARVIESPMYIRIDADEVFGRDTHCALARRFLFAEKRSTMARTDGARQGSTAT